ncbi:sigma-54-dependent transcriptional regulator [Bacteroidota bacterium]
MKSNLYGNQYIWNMILIVDDDKAILAAISLLLKQHGFETRTATDPDEANTILQSDPVSLVILDMNFTIETTGEDGLRFLRKIKLAYPDLPVILITAWGHMSLAIDGMKAGAADFLNKPWNNDFLVESVRTALNLSQKEISTESSGRDHLNRDFHFDNIVGEDPALMDLLRVVARISHTQASVLITGESGTGKELIAEAIHENSNRSDQPFVKVNLGAIPPALFESEMFGHKKGAFTDAQADRTGRFEEAHGGTLFLDEIGELDLTSQVKLLRVLQERKFEVLGSSQTRSVDVRIIAATNQDLGKLVLEGKFREDLLYRINLITIELPPLRKRKTDIPLLAHQFLNNLRLLYERPSLRITPKAMEWLSELPYPGNIRELKNLVERTVLLCDTDLLDIQQFNLHLSHGKGKGAVQLPAVGEMSLEEIEVEMIRRAMKFHGNSISDVARSLGISRNALYRRIEKYNLKDET